LPEDVFGEVETQDKFFGYTRIGTGILKGNAKIDVAIPPIIPNRTHREKAGAVFSTPP
jgi:hypothetical protein